jgi:hypothetical protein
METQAMISVILEIVGVFLFFGLMSYFLTKWADQNAPRN